MQTLRESELLGFVQLEIGSLSVRVPVRSAKAETEQPLASFEAEGDACAIVVRGDTSSQAVNAAMKDAVEVAARHFSRKLLN